MSYYIGLSVLSNQKDRGHSAKSLQKRHTGEESLRILSLFEDRNLVKDDIAAEEGGRPFLITGNGKKKPDVDFNISHCGDIIALTYVKGKALRTGCDIEKVRPRKNAPKIADEYFSSLENDYLNSGGNFDLKGFYIIWTLKESFLKLRGLSVFDMKAVPSFIRKNKLSVYEFCFEACVTPIFFRLYEALDAEGNLNILSAVIEGDYEGEPEIREFSSSDSLPLACKKIAEIKAAPSPAQTVSPKR